MDQYSFGLTSAGFANSPRATWKAFAIPLSAVPDSACSDSASQTAGHGVEPGMEVGSL